MAREFGQRRDDLAVRVEELRIADFESGDDGHGGLSEWTLC